MYVGISFYLTRLPVNQTNDFHLHASTNWFNDDNRKKNSTWMLNGIKFSSSSLPSRSEICFITKFIIEKSSIKFEIYHFPHLFPFKIMSKVLPVFGVDSKWLMRDALVKRRVRNLAAQTNLKKFVSQQINVVIICRVFRRLLSQMSLIKSFVYSIIPSMTKGFFQKIFFSHSVNSISRPSKTA